MIKNLLFTTILALTVGSAFAKDFELPETKPVISITIPDSWKPEELDSGVHGQSPDEGIYLSVESTQSEKGMDEIMKSTFEMLDEHKVVLDKASKKTSKFTIAGEEAEESIYSGKDEDGEATVSITLVVIGKNVFVFTYWATDEKVKKNQPTVVKIMKSIKSLK